MRLAHTPPQWLHQGQESAKSLAKLWPTLQATVREKPRHEFGSPRGSRELTQIPFNTEALEVVSRGEQLARDLSWIICADAKISHPNGTTTPQLWRWLGLSLTLPSTPEATAKRTALALTGTLERVEAFLGIRPSIRSVTGKCPRCGATRLFADLREWTISCTNTNCKSPATELPYRAPLPEIAGFIKNHMTPEPPAPRQEDK